MTAATGPRALARRRIARRTFLAAAAASSAAAALAACTRDRSPASQDRPKAGGTLRIATSLPLAQGLDPQIETGTGLAIFPRIYGYLHHVDPDGDKIRLDHAAAIEQPDPLTYIMRLRDGLRFHAVPPVDGRPVTSDDVARSIERYRDNPLVTAKAWHTSVFDRVDTPDARTAIVRTRAPFVYSLYELGAVGAGAILPREVVVSNQDLSFSGVGSGPFSLDAASPERVRIVRNGAYFAAPLPYLDAMEWRVVADDGSKIVALANRDADTVPIRGRAEATRAAALAPNIKIDTAPALAYLSIGLRVDRPPFVDERVREALDLGLDRGQMIRDIAPGDGELLGPVNPHLAGGFWSLAATEVAAPQHARELIESRRANARSLLAAAGAEGTRARMQVAKSAPLLDVANVVRDQLSRIGFTVEIEAIDDLAWFFALQHGSFEMTLISQPPFEWPDGPTRMYHSRGPYGAGNAFGFADAGIDALLERSWTEIDRDRRRATLLDAQRQMLRARPLLHLFTNTAYAAAWLYVRDRHPELPGSLAQYNYAQWLDR